MKQIIRIVILYIIAMVGFLAILCEPDESMGMLKWLMVMLVSKGIGLFAIILGIVLLDEWFGINIFEDRKESKV